MRTANTYQKSRYQQSHRKQSKNNSPDKRQEHDYVQAEEKLETAKQTIASMRKNYLKDINQLRNQMWLNDKYQHLNLLKQSNKNKNTTCQMNQQWTRDQVEVLEKNSEHPGNQKRIEPTTTQACGPLFPFVPRCQEQQVMELLGLKI